MRFLQRILLLLLLPLLALCAEDFYKILGVSKDAGDREIKKAYRSLSKKYHPDKNPNDESAQERFVEVANAYEILSNEETRQIYDTQGHDGIERYKKGARGRGAPDPMDLFRSFFGGGGFPGTNKGPSIEAKLAVPLKSFYTGDTQEFQLDKQIICETCSGSGSADGKLHQCGQCGGRGIVVQKQQLAMGIFQQMQMPCPACGGKGSAVKNPCKACSGNRVVQTQESFKVDIPRGFPRGDHIKFENEANESPDHEPGDILVHVLEQEPAEVMRDGERNDGTFFRRKDETLFWREVLSLREAWMGDWTRNITHLDGHVVYLSRPAGAVLQPGTVETVVGEGMPIYPVNEETGEHDFGNLLVEYVVVLPDKMDKSMEKEFRGVWDKWRSKKGIDLHKDSARPAPPLRHEEL